MNEQNNPASNEPRSPQEPGTSGPQPVNNAPSAGWGAPAATGWGAPAKGPSVSEGWGTPAPAPPAGTGWGAPQPERDKGGLPGRWTVKKTLVVAGVAVVVAAGTAAGFYSLGNAGSADAANVPPGQNNGQQGQSVPGQGLGPGGTGQDGTGQDGTGQGGPNQGMRGQAGGMAPDGLGMAGGLNAAIHSEYVILRDGQYVTMADQLGVVSDVSSASVTVKSTDGFTRTYVLNTDTVVAQGARQRGSNAGTLTLDDIKAGSTVRLTATKSGDSYIATSVRLTAATTSSGSSSESGTTS